MLRRHLDEIGIGYRLLGHHSLFDVVFTDREVRNYRDMLAADAARSVVFNRALREHGVLKSPGKPYLSLALTEQDFELTERAIAAAAAALAGL